MVQRKNKKLLLFEYIDVSDTTSYFNQIVKIAERENKWNFEALIFDLEKNVIFNDNLNNYKKDTLKKLKIIDKYYNLGSISKMNKVHDDCLNLFHKMIIIEIHDLLIKNNRKFYELIKNNIYSSLTIIDKCLVKLMNEDINNFQKNNLDKIIKKNIENFQVKRNIVKKYYQINRKIFPSNVDLLIMDLFNIQEVSFLIDYINNSKGIYENVVLPKNIVEKYNNNCITSCHDICNILIFRNKTQEKKKRMKNHKYQNLINAILYNHIILKFSNNIKESLSNFFNQYIMNELYISSTNFKNCYFS